MVFVEFFPNVLRVYIVFFGKDQSEVWCLYLFLLLINTVFMIEVPFIPVISDKMVTWRYRRQARSVLREVAEEVYVSISSMIYLSRFLWGLVSYVSFNFSSTLYFFSRRIKSLIQRLLIWFMVKDSCVITVHQGIWRVTLLGVVWCWL